MNGITWDRLELETKGPAVNECPVGKHLAETPQRDYLASWKAPSPHSLKFLIGQV